MSYRVVEKENGDSRCEKGNKVGNEEGSTTTLIRNPWKTPDVPQSDCRTDRREDESNLSGPFTPLGGNPIGLGAVCEHAPLPLPDPAFTEAAEGDQITPTLSLCEPSGAC